MPHARSRLAPTLLALALVAVVLAAPSRASAQDEDPEKPPEQPITAPHVTDDGPARPWAAGLFMGYSSAGLLGIDAERAIAGPFAAALSAGLWPRADFGTWTAHGGAALRARFLRDDAFHVAFEFGVAYGDEGRGTAEEPKYTGVLYLSGALLLEIENATGVFLRLSFGTTHAVAYRGCGLDTCGSNPNDPTDSGLPTILIGGGRRF